MKTSLTNLWPSNMKYNAIIHVKYTCIIRFMAPNNTRHKASPSVPFFKCYKTVTIQLSIRVRRYFVMSFISYHGSRYVGVIDNPVKLDHRPCAKMAAFKLYYFVCIQNNLTNLAFEIKILKNLLSRTRLVRAILNTKKGII